MHPAREHMELARTSVESINRGGVNPRNQANLLTSLYAAVESLVSEAEIRATASESEDSPPVDDKADQGTESPQRASGKNRKLAGAGA